ncbi:hypothetical protein BH09VER1_BH09VER1_04270 [soil metagenome]
MPSSIPNGPLHCEDVCLSDSKFLNVALLRAQFDDVALADAKFHNINLSGTKFDDINFSNARITNANVEGMTLFGIKVTDLFAAYEAQKDKG